MFNRLHERAEITKLNLQQNTAEPQQSSMRRRGSSQSPKRHSCSRLRTCSFSWSCQRSNLDLNCDSRASRLTQKQYFHILFSHWEFKEKIHTNPLQISQVSLLLMLTQHLLLLLPFKTLQLAFIVKETQETPTDWNQIRLERFRPTSLLLS